MGWFPDQPGGLNRYVRELVGALETAGAETAAVVVGPASDSGPTVTVARKRGIVVAHAVTRVRACRAAADRRTGRRRPFRALRSTSHTAGSAQTAPVRPPLPRPVGSRRRGER